MKNYDIFIQLCNTLTRILTEKYHLNQNTTMGQAIRITRRKNPVIAHHYDRLNAYVELRNVLVHEQYDEVLAEPSNHVLNTLKHIVTKLENPKRLNQLFQGDVYSIHTDETLYDVFQLISSKRKSHFPVFDNQHFIGVLTDNGISHYIANHRDLEMNYYNTVKVIDILPYEDHLTHLKVVHPKTEAYEVIDTFNNKNTRVSAILLANVENVTHPKQLKGILLPHDRLTHLNDIIGSFDK